MRTATIKCAWRAFGQAHFIPQSRGIIVMVALLLTAANLFAAATANFFSGGPKAGYPTGAGFANGDITGKAVYNTPCGIAMDLSGNYLLVADSSNNIIRVLEFDNNNAGTLLTFVGNTAVTNLFHNPVGVAIDSAYNIFVLNRGNGKDGNVLEINNHSRLVATNAVNLTNAVGMALDTSDNIYVTIKSNTVLKITSPGVSNVVATVPYADASLQGIVMQRCGPNAGLLAVCDSGRNGIYLINPTNGIVYTNAGFNGPGDFISTGDNIDDIWYAEFFQPAGVAETGDGSLIVTDFGNHRVKVVTSATVANLYGVTSNDWVHFDVAPWQYPGFVDGTVVVPDYPGGVAARMPNGVVLSPDGRFVYVTEDYYHIIRKVTGNFLPLPPPPPPPPTGLTATAGYGQVALMWVKSSGATSYNIKHAMSSGGPYSTIASIAGTNTSYTDVNVIDGTTNYFVVSAQNGGAESANSAVASAIPWFSPAPTILLPITTNYGLVAFSWTTSAGATSYNVKRAQSTGKETTIINTTNTSYTDTDVLNGTAYFYVVSALNGGGENPTNSLEVSATPPYPPPPPPRIGWFDYEGNNQIGFFSVLHPVSLFSAHNDVLIAIDPTTSGVTTNTLFTSDGSIPGIGNGKTPPLYKENSTAWYDSLIPGYTTQMPDMVIKAVNLGPGGSSAIVTAEFQFEVANPTIIGNNAAQFTVSDITTNSTIWYTIDGSSPSQTNGIEIILTNSNPVTLSLAMTGTNTSIFFQACAFRPGYLPSDIVSQTFSIVNYLPNIISFGFTSGEASSDFVASPGQFFYAPVTLTALPSTKIYSLQFNITVTNLGPIAIPGLFWFSSMLEKPDPNNAGYFLGIPTFVFISSGTNPPPDNDPNYYQYQGDWYQDLQFTDGNLLGIGWIERIGATNLYVTKSQDLITYSRAHDLLYPSPAHPGQIELGGYALLIPAAATTNDIYQIQIGRPSATSDGIGIPGSDVYIDAPTNGSTAGGSPMNAVKRITIGQKKYIAGSVYPFRWFNAGDFGSSNIVNADVEQVFEAAAYGLNGPLYESDFFDGMDSCGNYGVLDSNPADANYGYYTNVNKYPTTFSYTVTNTTIVYDTNSVPIKTNVITFPRSQWLYLTTYYVYEISTIAYVQPTITVPPSFHTNFVFVTNTVIFPTLPASLNTLFDGDDTAINQIAFGDGVLDICDVYVTFRRSLDPTLTWFRRFWNNGQRVADTGAPNIAANQSVSQISSASQSSSVQSVVQNGTSTPPQVNFSAGNIIGSAGNTVQIPINATVFGNYPLRLLMLNLSVVPLDGSPALTTPISFSANPALGQPYIESNSVVSYAAAWLDNTIFGLTGTANIGTLIVTIPANAAGNAAYAIHFDHASASPNGLASFPKQTLTGLVTLSSRANSTYGDGIPDLWRLRWFGTVNNILSVSNACPSGDGINNWQKFVAGVDPNAPNDFPSLNPKAPVPAGATAAIHWPTVSGKQYVILSSSSLFPGSWSAIATNTGTGMDMEFDDNSTGTVKFYRVQILP